MTRAIALLLFLAAAVAAALWLAARPEELEIALGAWRARMPATVAGLFAGVALLLAAIAGLLLRWLWSRPRALRGWASRRRRQRADQAVEGALVALSAGRHLQALREAERAGRLQGESTLTLWLTAQAAQAAGDGAKAEAALRLLTLRPGAAVIGLRGLAAREAEAGRTEAARALLAEATSADPGAVALKGIEAELAVRAQDWRAALAHARAMPADDKAKQRRAELALALAESEPAGDAKRALLKEAFATDPGFAPGVAAHAKALEAGGWRRRARKVMRAGWRANPHPAIAAVALVPMGRETRLDVLRRLRDLAAERPGQLESRVLVARAALEAEQWEEAGRQLAAAVADGIADRRVHLLRAELAERQGGDSETARAAAHAAWREAGEAQGEAAWRCRNCAAVYKDWTPVCEACRAGLSLVWSVPPRISHAHADASPAGASGDSATLPAVAG